MLRLSAQAWLLGVAALVAGCRGHASAEDCNRLLDRYVDLLLQDRKPPPDPLEVERLKAETRARAASNPHFKSCPSEVTRSQLECALAAPNADVLEQCLVM